MSERPRVELSHDKNGHFRVHAGGHSFRKYFGDIRFGIGLLVALCSFSVGAVVMHGCILREINKKIQQNQESIGQASPDKNGE